MILYFDNYITDKPLYVGTAITVDKKRQDCRNYRVPDKLSVCMYTLASYAELEWSNVIVKYELEDPSKNEYFEKFVKSLFPKAIIIRGRSCNQKMFRESVELIKTLGDEWIFYAGNVDHPFIAPETKTFYSCLAKAKEIKKQDKFVSMYYSHYLEYTTATKKDCFTYNKNWKVAGEDEHCVVVKAAGGEFGAVQIVHIDLLEHWFCSMDLGNTRIIRSDLLPLNNVVVPEQGIVLPKREMCTHFDGYGFDEIVPPLFIPPGFFEKDIKIAYGYATYRDGWVNINPTKEKYVFSDRVNGTDLKITLENLPLFWKGRIGAIDKNPALDERLAQAGYEKDLQMRSNVWSKRSFFAWKMHLEQRLHFVKRDVALLRHVVENPAYLKERMEGGAGPRVLIKKSMYDALMFGYATGIFRKKGQEKNGSD